MLLIKWFLGVVYIYSIKIFTSLDIRVLYVLL
jgi:hypothetical protein